LRSWISTWWTSRPAISRSWTDPAAAPADRSPAQTASGFAPPVRIFPIASPPSRRLR
jgi:hypothetical protein